MDILIVTGGKAPSMELLSLYSDKADFIIGVDSGCECLFNANINPNIILGDFDSVSNEVLDFYKNNGVIIEKFNPEKDYSDTHLAYRRAKEINKNVDNIYFLGATGDRIDHMLGNIGLLVDGLNTNINIKIIDDKNEMYLVDKDTVIKKRDNRYLSFHAISDVVYGFTIKNAKYELNNYDLKILEPRAICNEFLEDNDVEIKFKKGRILIIISRD